MEEKIDEFFNGKNTITKEELKKALEDFRMGRGGGGGRGGRGKGAMNRSGPIQEEMKQKLTQLLESELNKINSNSITKEQAKSVLSSFGSQAKEQWHAQMDQYIQSSIKDELTKLNINEVNGNQARDLLRNISRKMRPTHVGGSPAMLDDNMKNEFMNEFKSKYGTNKISGDEAWELIKVFDKKQHDKMGCCEKNAEWEKEKDKKWEDIYNEQYKELFGDLNKKINQQQLEDLAKKIKEKFRQDWPQNSGKRFCQH
jgi:hypothetical protein